MMMEKAKATNAKKIDELAEGVALSPYEIAQIEQFSKGLFLASVLPFGKGAMISNIPVHSELFEDGTTVPTPEFFNELAVLCPWIPDAFCLNSTESASLTIKKSVSNIFGVQIEMANVFVSQMKWIPDPSKFVSIGDGWLRTCIIGTLDEAIGFCKAVSKTAARKTVSFLGITNDNKYVVEVFYPQKLTSIGSTAFDFGYFDPFINEPPLSIKELISNGRAIEKMSKAF